MTTNDDQYVPSEKAVRRTYTYYYDPATIRRPDTEQEFDRFLARVKRDAALLDALAQAEARIKAVQDVLSTHESILGDTLGVPVENIRRALDGER